MGVQGAVPGWRQTLEALLEWVDPATEELEQPSEPSISEEAEGFGDADNGKVKSRTPFFFFVGCRRSFVLVY